MVVPAGCTVKDSSVVLDGVDQELLNTLSVLGSMHHVLFGTDLVITSGKDGQHVAGSLHMEGRAVDIRTHDLRSDQALTLVMLIANMALTMPLGYYWEVRPPGGAHIHLEWTGA